MKGTKVWYFNTNNGKKGIFANARVASEKTGAKLTTLQLHLREHGQWTWKGWIFARREIEK